MIRNIMKDQIFLSKVSEDVSKTDDYNSIAQDLKDTLKAHEDECVGMAANMIGIRKKMIIVTLGFAPMILINPKIVKKSGQYETEEGCLSLTGVRKCTRYKNITVEYYDMGFEKRRKDFTGFLAENIQHQCDHCRGIVI